MCASLCHEHSQPRFKLHIAATEREAAALALIWFNFQNRIIWAAQSHTESFSNVTRSSLSQACTKWRSSRSTSMPTPILIPLSAKTLFPFLNAKPTFGLHANRNNPSTFGAVAKGADTSNERDEDDYVCCSTLHNTNNDRVKGWVCQHGHYRNGFSVGSHWRQTGLKNTTLQFWSPVLQTTKKRNWRNREDDQCKSMPHPMFGRYWLMVIVSHKCQPSKPVREWFANSNI